MKARRPLHTRVFRAGLALGAIELASGCGDSGFAEHPARAAQTILGGDANDADPAVVALLVRTPAGGEGLCSGVVVAPRVVVTAAHCVAPEAVGRDASFSVFVGSDLGDPAQTSAPDAITAVARVSFDPEFSLGPIARGHDVGVAITEAPLAVAPLPFDPPPELVAGSTLRLVGFGVSSAGDAASAGRKRDAVVSLSSHDSLFLLPGPGPTPCDGDSGGPALLSDTDGVERVAGIVSFAEEGCGSTAPITNISSYLSYLGSEIAAVDPGEPAAPRRPRESSGASCHVASDRELGDRGWLAALLGALALWSVRRAARLANRRARTESARKPRSALAA